MLVTGCRGKDQAFPVVSESGYSSMMYPFRDITVNNLLVEFWRIEWLVDNKPVAR